MAAKVYADVQLPEKVTESSVKTLPASFSSPRSLFFLLLLPFRFWHLYLNMVLSSISFCVLDLQRVTMADRFDCDSCKESLYGRKYIQSDDSPYCIPCYDSLFSNTCDECKELIGHDARVRKYFSNMIKHAIGCLLHNNSVKRSTCRISLETFIFLEFPQSHT